MSGQRDDEPDFAEETLGRLAGNGPHAAALFQSYMEGKQRRAQEPRPAREQKPADTDRATSSLPGVEAIMRAMDRNEEERRRHQAREEKYRCEAEAAEQQRSEFLAHCQPATLIEYTAWMIGYLQAGGEPSHVYERPFAQPAMQLSGSIGAEGSSLRATEARTSWWVLAETPEGAMPSLYGANSLHIIVPAGLAYTPEDVPRTFHGQCGHSTVYFMDGCTSVGDWAPVYSDMLPVLAAGL